ncbi:MAG: glycoside hydrolase family 88 protein [Clostridiales bacterium]|nr:glycoside hydrolase family 88 protein [Clostridiales bacterium]
MGYYFDDSRSINAYDGTDARSVLSSLAYRYMGQNLKHGLYYRAYTNNGIVRTTDYRYKVDLNEFFPGSREKDCVWAYARVYSEKESALGWDINCFGPMTMYVNGEEVYKSDIFKERYSENATRIFPPLKKGWNELSVRFQKTKAGFGAQFGTWIGKHDMYVLMPTAEREGQEGWVFTEPVSDSFVPEFVPGMSEKDFSVKLYPDISVSEEDMKKGCFTRMYGVREGSYAVGAAKAFFSAGSGKYRFTINSKGSSAVYIDNTEIFSAPEGKSEFDAEVAFGTHIITVKTMCGGDWGFTLDCAGIRFESACNVKGANGDPWMYIGPFDADFDFPFEEAMSMYRVIDNKYWRVDIPDTFIRPYNENTLFGRWNYPLGVTVYGLLHTALVLESEDIKNYIREHIQLCIDTFDYALWDKTQYGGATSVHNLLTSIDSLDDCGSFASTMLEVHKYLGLEDVKKVADYVGDYITNGQPRLEDGTFFRKKQMHSFHNMTMWADDLYMSVPFLSRYYKFTGDVKYADDAANQFFGFKKRLFMPEEGIMSHVYDFKYDTQTGVPWGRGNGWVVFSMTELLAVLPEDHPRRGELIEFLNTLCQSYLKLQDGEGMWHQVLNDHDSYPETSCTSMFIYAFSRGVRYGWLKEPEKYISAVYKAWEALTKTSVDTDGNVYGVCRGSEFSFIPDYYKYELGWRLNDTHGFGIVMLAGVELLRLEDYLKK